MRKFRWRADVIFIMVLSLASCLWAAAPAAGASEDCGAGECRVRILFDESHEERGTISYERALEMDPTHGIDWFLYGRLAEMLAERCTLVRGVEPITVSSLEGFDVLLVTSPEERFTQKELDAIYSFVTDGGGLLVAQDTNPAPTCGSNQLASMFDCRFVKGILRSEHGDWDAESFRVDIALPGHAAVHGVDEFQMNWGCPIEVPDDWEVLLTSKPDTWLDKDNSGTRGLNEVGGPLAVAAAGYVGTGRVVLVGDNAFQDTVMGANWIFFVNAVDWLVGEATYFEGWSAEDEGALTPVVSSAYSEDLLVRFFPDRWELEPGETVVWTIEAVAESALPLYIRPELDNDVNREPLIVLDKPSIQIEFTYDEENLYVPFLEVADPDGQGQKVYPETFLVVESRLERRSGVGLSVPGLAGGESDFIKAVRVTGYDATVYGTPAGLEDMRHQLERIASLGANLAVFNLDWYFDGPSSSIHEPLYGRTWPVTGFGTLPLGVLTQAVDWCHELGMRVGLCYFLTEKEGHFSGKRGRYTYEPADDQVYLEWQTAIHVKYAEICERLGVELFILDAENDYFTQNPGVRGLIEEVREVYGGLVTEQAYTVDRVWSCPFADQLDFVAWSDYYFGFADLSNRDVDQATLEKAFLRHYEVDVLPVLEHVEKPGMFLELGSNFRELGDERGAEECKAYLEVISGLTDGGSSLVGLCWWDWNLEGEDRKYPHSIRGRSAEDIVQEYFCDVLPDRVQRMSSVAPAHECSTEEELASFARWDGLTIHTYVDRGHSTFTLDADTGKPSPSLRIEFTPLTSQREVVTAGIYEVPSRQQDWTQHESVCFWFKSDAMNCNCVSVLEFQVFDADGDRFTFRTSARTYLSGWQLVTMDLDLLSFPSWIPDSQPGNGELDLSRVARWGVVLQWDDGRTHNAWLDSVNLGSPLEVSPGSSTGAADTDGDGVPDDDDLCPDWPGSAGMSGC